MTTRTRASLVALVLTLVALPTNAFAPPGGRAPPPKPPGGSRIFEPGRTPHTEYGGTRPGGIYDPLGLREAEIRRRYGLSTGGESARTSLSGSDYLRYAREREQVLAEFDARFDEMTLEQRSQATPPLGWTFQGYYERRGERVRSAHRAEAQRLWSLTTVPVSWERVQEHERDRYGVPRREVDTSRNWKSPKVRVVDMAA